MSTKMTKLIIKIHNKHIKGHIVKWAIVIKMFLNTYVWKNAFRTEKHTKCSWYIIENYSKNKKQQFLYELIFQKLQNVTRFW